MSLEFVEKAPENVGKKIYSEKFSSTLEEKDRVVEEIMEHIRGKYLEEDSEEDIKVRLGIEEALTNAVEHGNKCNPDKSIDITLCGNEEKWSLRIVGEGEGFEMPKTRDHEEDALSYRGRGLTIIESMINNAYYYDHGNAILLIHQNHMKE